MEAIHYTDFNSASLYFAFLLSMGLAFMVVPSIRAISRRWSLYDFNISQEVTLSHIPRFGGVALIIGFAMSAAVFAPTNIIPGMRYILASSILLMAAGIKDDLMHLSSFMLMMIIVGAGSILTDVAGMPLIYTGIDPVLNYPLVDLLLTFGILIGCVYILNIALKIQGLVSLILLLCSLTFAILFIRSGFPGHAITPLALAGASLTLFICALGNYVFEGKAAALIGGFLLAIFINTTSQYRNGLNFNISSLTVLIFLLIVIPGMILLGFITMEHKRVRIFNKYTRIYVFQLSLLLILFLLLLL